MRQVGSLPNQREAERFSAYLVTQGIDAHAEQDTHEWAVWVRDEDRIEQARQSLEHFRVDPEDNRYRGVERDAEVIRRGELQRRMSAQKNVVEMRGRWLQPTIRKTPLTITVIVLSVVVTVFGNFGKAQRGIGQTMNQQLWFCARPISSHPMGTGSHRSPKGNCGAPSRPFSSTCFHSTSCST